MAHQLRFRFSRGKTDFRAISAEIRKFPMLEPEEEYHARQALARA